MQQRGLEVKEIGKKVAVYSALNSPQKNLDNFPTDLAAYVFHDGYLYFVDQDNENKCIYIKLSNQQMTEVKKTFGLMDSDLKKKPTQPYQSLFEELSSEQ